MGSPFLDRLADGVVVFDGSMGVLLQGMELAEADFHWEGRLLDGCNEILSLNRPDVIRSVHESYFEAGADIVETNTFGATSIVLAEYDVPHLVREITLASARIAREAAGPDRFVCGALGPGTKLVSLGQTSFEEILTTYADGFVGLIEGGADVLLLETLQDMLMVKAGIIAANRAMAATERRLPLMVQVTMEQTGTMLLGTDMAAALCGLEQYPSVIAVGLNCATGPTEMAPHVRFLGEHSTRPISIQPNAGLPVMERGRAVYKVGPEELAIAQERFVVEHGVALVGGCCGTRPEHIRAIAERVKGRPHTAGHWTRVRNFYPGFDFSERPGMGGGKSLVGATSLFSFQPYIQDNSFLIVGEKTNANGSKAFREGLAAENWEGLVEIAREEAEASHVLDVCTAYVGRDESRDMAELLSRLNRQITIPIMIDSTELDVMERSLRTVGGKPILNSINFENGEDRPRKVLGLAREYGAAVVALTIDERGMAKSVEDKIAVAERLLALAREYGLPDEDLFVDCLTFTLGSGEEEFRGSAIATIEAIRTLRERHPRVNTLLGLSNVSFGLRPAARQILNSVFLEATREAGLTSAIVHATKLRPRSAVDPDLWRIAEDLVHDRRRFALQ